MTIRKADLPKLACAIISYAKKHTHKGAFVLLLSGDLGAGKTTLAQHIAEELGVAEVATSPTFVIMRIYASKDERFSSFVHIDAYRLESKAELAPLRLGEVFAGEATFVCIEWPEKLFGQVPQNALEIRLSSASEDERELAVSEHFGDYLQKYI